MAHVTEQEHIQSQIGRYEVIALLGRGGMGVVYRAYDPALDRPVALKLLAPELAQQPGLVNRLRREAISTARLRHPNIALLYEFSQVDDTPFLAMEYVPGVSLRQLLAEGPLPIARALHLLDQIAQALDCAHAAGIVHRDVKPSNILVGADDHAMLIDFGLAEMAENSLWTADSAVLGTPHYMAPEQAAGRGADGRSDQYALAAVAYELLTGVAPFQGRSATAVIHAHIYEPPPPPTEHRPSLPVAANAVLLRALAKAPAARYPTVALFVADLCAACAAPVRAPRRAAWRWLRVGALTLALVAALLLALFGRTLVPTLWVPPPPVAHSGVPLPQQVAWMYDPGLVGGSAPVVVADTVVFATLDGSLVALNAASGDLRWLKDGRAQLFGTPSAGAGRIFVGNGAGEVFCLVPQSGEVVWRQRVQGAVEQAPTRNNERLVVTTTTGAVYVLNAANGQPLWEHQLAGSLGVPTIGAGSVFVGSARVLTALDISTGAVRWTFATASTITTQPVISENLVLVGTTRGLLYGLDLASGEQRLRHQARGTLNATPAVDADTVFIADQAGMLTALSPSNAREIWHFDADTAITATPVLADGKLFFATNSGSVYAVDARSGRQLATLRLGGSVISAPALGDDLLYVSAGRIYALGP